jgi:hypothetical protein
MIVGLIRLEVELDSVLEHDLVEIEEGTVRAMMHEDLLDDRIIHLDVRDLYAKDSVPAPILRQSRVFKNPKKARKKQHRLARPHLQ